ncbi:MAG: ABC transporter permease [Clostridia bacterium]|nr:ABC transporter permease [Clostridia bacterium]
MKSGLYVKTAWNNIKKNYRFYIPQILTGVGLLTCLYIVYTLKADERIKGIPGGDYMPLCMSIGTAIISLLSLILILYTNSFLMKQRKREYGLYNILGMEKRHIGKILFWETAISVGISVILGSGMGVLFYKLCSLLICSIFKTDIVLGFDFITWKTILPPAVFFVFLYLFAFIVNRIGIARMKPIEMLQSKHTGEKEPKVKWVIFILGLVTLIGGYVISIVTTNPLSALLLFFAAVFLVIIGTYCLFTAGSIFVLKALKRNKKYYYNKKHMPSVSGLLYRMKQNAVGLASICILATGVLVMISTTVSLYSGMQETLDSNYPQDLYLSCNRYSPDNAAHPVSADVLTGIVENSAEKHDIAIKSVQKQKYLCVSYMFDGKKFMTSRETNYNAQNLANVVYITEKTYTGLTGKELGLKPDELAIRLTSTTIGTTKQPAKTVTLHGKTYQTTSLDSFPVEVKLAMISPSGYGIVVKDDDVLNDIFMAQGRDYGENASEMTERIAVTYEDRAKASAVGTDLLDDIYNELYSYLESQGDSSGGFSITLNSYWDAKEAVIGMYGALLFLGIILGLVCLFATVLIIYYKQISEGYEDRERYQIMKKVGMSDGEIRKTIRSQTLLVFFLPLVFAGIHTAFAFPMLNRLLHLILLSSTSLFVICTLITFAVFALVYVVIYSMTAKTYYKIVH